MSDKPNLIFASKDDLFGGLCDPPFSGYAVLASSEEGAAVIRNELEQRGLLFESSETDALWAGVVEDCKEKGVHIAGTFKNISNETMLSLQSDYELVKVNSVRTAMQKLTENLGFPANGFREGHLSI